MTDGVLENEPRGVSRFLANHRPTWPPMPVDDLGQSAGIAIVDGLHSWVVAVKQGPVTCQLVSDPAVLGREGDQFCRKGLIESNRHGSTQQKLQPDDKRFTGGPAARSQSKIPLGPHGRKQNGDVWPMGGPVAASAG
jgi:hypothetical protein